MNIIVCAKQVVDVSEMKIDSSTKKPILQGVPQKISDIDKNAMEEAIKIKDKHGGKITVLTIGPSDAKERIKELLAMGADEGILVTAPDNIDYHMTSTLLAEAVKKIGEYDMILCGEASVDLFSGQIGPRLAGLLNIPQITYALTVTAEKDKVTAERNMGDNEVTTEATYPVLITVTKEINEPRLPSLMQILGAANKPINEWTADSLSSRLKPLVETVDLKGVSMERKNVIYQNDLDESVGKLVDSLAKEGVLGG
ncbi:MAG: electron transfer flavoprotein subunit beta/FixA family protein [Thermoplasmatales archaeon]|nr:electron transfer flavoprotein subunit beta/FixA family protein [Thermoplasmatales archaeon]MCK5636068.1 electron transfer flavoprotein subunit beta/FixA family protein [Thermoplasmatales archaeon]